LILVGLTGGLGAGKSTVARMLAERGAVVVDADDLARQAIAKGTPGHARVVEAFGHDVLAEDGEVDRRVLAGDVFASSERRRLLEEIVHPEVFRLLGETVAAYRSTDSVVVFDAPLIIETGFDEVADIVIVVTAPVEQRIERVGKDRGMSAEEARARIAAQVPAEEREAAADLIIRNDAGPAELQREVDRVWADLQGRGGSGG
jgi:dephospho-CoA kinase